MDNFRDSYFQINWDLGKKRLNNSVWGKQYDTGRGLAITLINNGIVVTPSNEIIRLKWEKSDGTAGYVNSTVVSGKFLLENIDQMFTVAGMVKADLELQVAGEFVASVTFFVSVDKAIAVDAIESSSDFTALQDALADVGDIQTQFDAVIANATVDSEVILARGTKATLVARLDSTDAQLAETDQRIDNIAENLESIIFDGKSKLSLTWEQGTISSTGEQASTTRIRSKEFIELAAHPDLIFEIVEGYQFNVVYYNSSKVRTGESGWVTSIVLPTTAIHIRILLSKVNLTAIIPSESTNFTLTYTVTKLRENEVKSINLNTGSVTPDKTTFLRGGGMYNLFNGKYIRLYLELSKLHRGDNYQTVGQGIILPVTGGSAYYIRKDPSSRFAVGFHKTVINLANYPTSPSALTVDYPVSSPVEGAPIVAPADAKYMIVYTSNLGDSPRMQITKDSDRTFFTGYGFSLDLEEKSVETLALKDGETITKLFSLEAKELGTYHFLGDINSIYKSPDIPLAVDLGDYGKLITAYDGLVSAFPNYVTKSVVGTDGYGNTMYEYKFTAPSMGNVSAYTPRRLKLLITTGVHGHEHQTVLAAYRFFHELCNNPRNIEELDYIKWNIDFRIIPCVVPSAYRISRNNANNVNINRNFPAGWALSTESGASAASEPETQNAIAWFESNLDANYYIDYHAQAENKLTFYITNNTAATISQSVIRVYEKRWRELSGIPETYALSGYVRNAMNGMTVKHSESLGINAVLPDCPWIGYSTSPVEEQRIVLEIFANTVYALVKKN